MASANATLVMGFRLDELCEIRTVEGPPRFDQNTGKPVPNPVDAMFILGKQVEDPVEFYPSEWHDELSMKTFGCGDGSENYPHRGLRAYRLETFVAGIKIASTPSDQDHGGMTVVPDMKTKEDEAYFALAELCKKVGVEPNTVTLQPKLYMVCYYAY